MRRFVVLLLVVSGLGSVPAQAQEATDHVQIRNNSYAPPDIRVEPGAVVTWTLSEGRHTVTSDRSKIFDSGVLERTGQTFSFRSPRHDVTLYYHCRIHGTAGTGDRWGSGMVGRIVVGAGSPEPPPPPGVEVRKVPSRAWRTLDEALRGLEPDGQYLVELARGTYASRDLTAAKLGFRGAPGPRFELTIRGSGAHPTDVLFRGEGTALTLSADGLYLENVSLATDGFAALLVRGVDRWGADDVVVKRTGSYGVAVEGSTHGHLRRVSVAGAKIAGIAVTGCNECDLVVDSVNVQRSLQGFSALSAGSLVVRGSTFRNNGVGIALKTRLGDYASRGGVHVFQNTLRDDVYRKIAGPQPGPEKNLPVGAGIWIDGGSFTRVESNDVRGHSFGVVVTGPVDHVRVESNTLSRSVEADVAWDGLGDSVCFAANKSPSGGAVAAMPEPAQELNSCTSPAVVGIPFPVVDALLYAWGLALRGP